MRVPVSVAALFVLVLAGCAVIIAPSGGVKDITPPGVVSSVPENYSANFNATEIEIEFDEFIKLRDLFNNFIISPPLDAKPDIMIRGKSVIVKLDEPLDSNTTFNFSFGNAIVDIHEGNPIADYHFVVSTGTFVDSLGIHGIATDALTLKPAEDVWVTMYECPKYSGCDSLPSKDPPKYLTKTNKAGFFRIGNIQAGKYKVFALVDKNRNYLFDLPNESIGFIGNVIEAGDSTELRLSIFDQEDGNQKISKAWSPQRGLIKLAFKLPVGEVKIAALNFSSKKAWEVVDYTANRDTVLYWNSSGIDSLELYVSDGRHSFEDTVVVGLGQKREYSKLTVSTSCSKTRVLEIGQSLKIYPSKPLVKYDEKRIQLFERGDSANYEQVNAKLSFADAVNKVIEVNYDWKPGYTYRLHWDQGALTDFFQGVSDSASVNFSLRKEEYYGNAEIEVAFPKSEHPYIVQLVDAREKVSREDIGMPGGTSQDYRKKFDYKYLAPGKYKMKVIYDVNGNGRWDTGHHLENRQPEKIVFSTEEIRIRSNWDLVLDWELEP